MTTRNLTYAPRPSRRDWLRRAAAAGTGLLLPGCASSSALRGEPDLRPAEAERWVLLADTHVHANPAGMHRGVNMAGHLRAAVRDVLRTSAAGPAPAGAIVAGDCAFRSGQAGDYARMHDLLTRPLIGAGIPVHLALGNHDHRERFRRSLDSLPSDAVTRSPLESHWVSVVPGRWANFFLLDSLDRTNIIPGRIGPAQLRWLDAVLAGTSDKPALVVGHHPLTRDLNWLGAIEGLADGAALCRVLDRHPHVKAYLFGHNHVWEITRRRGVHLVSLPSTAYVFSGRQPSAWVDLWLGRDGARLEVRPVQGDGTAKGLSEAIHWV